MTAQLTTEPHRPPTEDQGPAGAPVWIVAFPEPLAVPLPPLGAAVGRAYFAAQGRSDTEISSNHFRLSRAGGTLRIEDLESRNGTWIDGHRLAPRQPAPLSEGAVIRLGKSLFVNREALEGPLVPDRPLDGLISPWGLRAARQALAHLRALPETAILIQGETGTGKELMARAVAAALGRERPFEAVNVAALAQAALEGHLFGWERGAFTGADRTNPGLIRANAGGTVFLDEIGELSMDLQAKLLRLLENREVQPIGANRSAKVDVAFVAATNRELSPLLGKSFREDLFARFRVRIELPPLCQRPEDLLSMLVVLWERRRGASDLARAHMDVEAMELLLLHGWSLNVRELDSFAVSLRGNAFELKLAAVRSWLGPAAKADRPPPVTRDTLEAALAAHSGNQVQAAKALGVDRGVVQRLLRKHPELKAVGVQKK